MNLLTYKIPRIDNFLWILIFNESYKQYVCDTNKGQQKMICCFMTTRQTKILYLHLKRHKTDFFFFNFFIYTYFLHTFFQFILIFWEKKKFFLFPLPRRKAVRILISSMHSQKWPDYYSLCNIFHINICVGELVCGAPVHF